ncbi:MAG TPA: branched-chain amino acid ABC transporter permease [Streptosporangiaceae bacterium]|jgi:branched-chain amino acid transport system permease protein/neutral amino acid transport system permease protein|nr:branched-chain amino acid ABC transporter permease [Streptosporangiaceae bacterium]
MHQFLLAVGFGLVTASVVAIAAVGLSLQFGITNYINFAYGDFMALGAYLTWELNTGLLHWNIWVAMIGGSVAMGVVGVLLNQFLLGPFARRFDKLFYILIVTFGLSLIILSLLNSVWGADVRHYSLASQHPLHIGPFLLTADQIVVVVLGAVLMVSVHLLLTRTRLGKSMRAMSDDTTLAMTSGIDTRRITMITWFLTGLLAGLAGTVLGITSASITPSFGETFLFVIFAAVIVGGVGSVYGAIVGAIIIGMATEISAVYINAAYKLDTAFVILIFVLLFRPSGLFSRAGKA